MKKIKPHIMEGMMQSKQGAKPNNLNSDVFIDWDLWWVGLFITIKVKNQPHFMWIHFQLSVMM